MKNYIKSDAIDVLNKVHQRGVIDYGEYNVIFDGIAEIETLSERDSEIEELWEALEDIAFDEDEDGRLLSISPYIGFPAGTEREDIWKWFDERHSKGVAYLLGFA